MDREGVLFLIMQTLLLVASEECDTSLTYPPTAILYPGARRLRLPCHTLVQLACPVLLARSLPERACAAGRAGRGAEHAHERGAGQGGG